MDVAHDPHVHTIVGMKPSRMGFTEVLINTILKTIDDDPAPILYVQQTVEMAERFSKAMLWPAIRDTQKVAGKIAPARSRDSGNTILDKDFPGGDLSMIGANSPRGFRMVAKKYVMLDDVDGFEHNVGDEGDPVDLAIRRADTFPDKKIWLFSSPTVKGASRIEAAFAESDQRYYEVPCPFCQTYQVLLWRQLKFESRDPVSTSYECQHCAKRIGHRFKMPMLRRGRWVPTAPFRGIAGFHLNKLYSPFVTWNALAEEFLRAHEIPERLQVFCNTALAETYDVMGGEKLEPHTLAARREPYGPELPREVVALTAGVDVQQDRLEVEVVGWGKGEESWGIERRVFRGDLTDVQGEAWTALDLFLQKTYAHALGFPLRISGTCIDTGYATKEVYGFTRLKHGRGLFAIKGSTTFGAPPFVPPSRGPLRKGKIKLYLVGVSTLKMTLFERLKKTSPGPGYLHYPQTYEGDFFEQLTAEKLVTKYEKGFPRRQWVREGRNEALDCRIYAMAALAILGWDLEALAGNLERVAVQRAGGEPAAQAPAPAPQPPKGRRVISQGVA